MVAFNFAYFSDSSLVSLLVWSDTSCCILDSGISFCFLVLVFLAFDMAVQINMKVILTNIKIPQKNFFKHSA
ncbi:hypothetical protein V6O07_04140, partial [Arthrospira platensis SPKY2]